MKKFSILFIIFGLILSGCSTATQVHVSSFAAPSYTPAMGPGPNYYVILPDPTLPLNPQDLQFQEFASYVDKALVAKGYARLMTNDPKVALAKTAVVLGYSVHVMTQQDVIDMPYFYYGHGGYWHGHEHYYVRGYSAPEYYTYTTYVDHINIAAVQAPYDPKSNTFALANAPQLWRTDLTSVTETSDFRSIFPLMIAAGYDFIGTSSRQDVTINIEQGDARVKEIEGLKVK